MNDRILKVSKQPFEDLILLLEENIIGTPEKGMLYRQMKAREKVHKIANPYFVNLYRAEKLIGTCCFCRRLTNTGETCFYIRYFSFKGSYRSKGSLELPKIKKEGVLRNEISELLQGKHLEVSEGEKFFHYAYVDPNNVRSAYRCEEFGFKKVRDFSTILFTRFFPKSHNNFSKLAGNEVEHMRMLIKDLYSSYRMFNFENLLLNDNYYVIKEKGEIVAGASVNYDYWQILNVPGYLGNLLIKYFSHIPVLKNIINKEHYFISIEGIYFKEGHEKALEYLFASLLFKFKTNTAMMWADSRSTLYDFLQRINLGNVSKVNKVGKADVICIFRNYSNSEIEGFKSNPSYISSIDLT